MENTPASGDAEIVIGCPYCLSPVDEHVKLCPTCNEDTTLDALVEMTREDYLNEERKTCRFCNRSMPKLAVVCPACRTWQDR